MTSYKVIAFDADDTLWVNEPYFREAEIQFAQILAPFETENKIHHEFYQMMMKNLPLYGYGVKSCILSMVECANELSNGQLTGKAYEQIVALGKDMLTKPIELLDGIGEVLKELSQKYKLIVLTKGDLLDQEKKLERSGLLQYFHHVEVMSDKNPKGYKRVLQHLEIHPKDFLMIGNSLKSDVIPVLEIGADAIHIPYVSEWKHEMVSEHISNQFTYKTLQSCRELMRLL